MAIRVILFIKDFELGSRLSTACVDSGCEVIFADENSDPASFDPTIKLAIVDMNEEIFSSVGLISELKRRGIRIIGTKTNLNNKERTKLQNVGCDIILNRNSLIKSISRVLTEFLDSKPEKPN
tara:strand:+ start:114 stop:482 length:369 start_codon:yes stop_codon:yes gene_type:complete